MVFKWWRFLRDRIDLLVLFSLLGGIYAVWFWGVSVDMTAETKVEQSTKDVSVTVDSLVAENRGVIRALGGFVAGSEKINEKELERFLNTLFGDRVWGGIEMIKIQISTSSAFLVKIDSNGKASVTDNSVFEKGNYFSFEKAIGEKNVFVETYVRKDEWLEKIKRAIPGDVSWSFWVNDEIYDNISDSLEMSGTLVEKKGEVDFADKRITYVLKVVDRPGDIWNIFLALGGLVSFVVYTLVFSLSIGGKKVREEAELLLVDYIKYKRAIESLDSHLIITNTEGTVLFANQAVSTLTGYGMEEIIGSKPSLWGRQMPNQFYEAMWDTIKNKREVFKGEVTNRRKNGSLYTAYAVISPIIDDKNDLIGFVGSETDITERKRSEDEQKRLNEMMVGRELKMVELKKKIASLEKGL